MRFHHLACDYDGTLAHHGRVDSQTLDALRRLKDSGRHLVLVTGRRLDDLAAVFPETKLFDMLVVENGAVLVDPATGNETLLAAAPPPLFVEELKRRGVAPVDTGRIIVATWQPHETVVFETVRDLGLELQVIFNKGAVMILPSGVNKASGLKAALRALNLSERNTVAVGDAENDHSFMLSCEAAVAVRNALPMVKDTADWVCEGEHGHGVAELTGHLLQDDLLSLEGRFTRRLLHLGTRADDQPVWLNPGRGNLLIAGTSGGGKSTLVQSFIELLVENGYQYCLIDPEGDHEDLEQTVILGDAKHTPSVSEIITSLTPARQNVSVNLVSLPLGDRPAFCDKLLVELASLRQRLGHPHWVILDETHHMLPSQRDAASGPGPELFDAGFLFVTVEPAHVARAALEAVDLMLTIGAEPGRTIANFCGALGETIPEIPDVQLTPGDVVGWNRKAKQDPFWFRSHRPKQAHRRHSRKYAQGDMGANAFIFTGPDNRLHLKAQNLLIFLQMAEGVDEVTWTYHLRRGDFEKWFRSVVKDDELADFVATLASQHHVNPAEQQRALHEKVEARYTAPA